MLEQFQEAMSILITRWPIGLPIFILTAYNTPLYKEYLSEPLYTSRDALTRVILGLGTSGAILLLDSCRDDQDRAHAPYGRLLTLAYAVEGISSTAKYMTKNAMLETLVVSSRKHLLAGESGMFRDDLIVALSGVEDCGVDEAETLLKIWGLL